MCVCIESAAAEFFATEAIVRVWALAESITIAVLHAKDTRETQACRLVYTDFFPYFGSVFFEEVYEREARSKF